MNYKSRLKAAKTLLETAADLLSSYEHVTQTTVGTAKSKIFDARNQIKDAINREYNNENFMR